MKDYKAEIEDEFTNNIKYKDCKKCDLYNKECDCSIQDCAINYFKSKLIEARERIDRLQEELDNAEDNYYYGIR